MSKELDYITELERKNRLLGERCNQLLKDKGDLTDQIADIKANCDFALEGKDIEIKELKEKHESSISQWKYELNKLIHNEVELSKENKTLEGCLLAEQEYTLTLEKQIEKMKCCGNCWHWHYDCYDGVVIRQATEQDRRENYKNWGEQIPCKNKDHWKLEE